MLDFRKHEQFEMEVLKLISDHQLLTHLVFGGGTCMRLCFGLNRYSVDLDFWQKPAFSKGHFEKMRKVLKDRYEITDYQAKRNTYLLEIRSPDYPKRLKIEIRRGLHAHLETELNVAFSPFALPQIRLHSLTLRQIGLNKVRAFLERKEMRDAYDLEFIYKKGQLNVAEISKIEKQEMILLLKAFTIKDFKVKLGSLLEADERDYYVQRGFQILMNALR